MVTVDRRVVEAPVVFGRDRSLVGAVCIPAESSGAGDLFVVFLSSGIIHRAGPNRNYVRVARALARAGIPSLRFDLSGIGDSVLPPGVQGMSIQERVAADIDDALGFLDTRYGTERFVLIGLCSGADNALRTMGRDERVVGSVLLDLNVHRTRGFYLRHYARRALRLESWLNILTGRHPVYGGVGHRLRRALGALGEDDVVSDAPELNLEAWLPRDLMREHLERCIARRCALLCIFTAGLETQYNYREQFLHLFPKLDFRGCLRLEYFADSDHTFSRVALQDRLTGTIVEWVEQLRYPGSPDRTRADVFDRLVSGGPPGQGSVLESHGR